MLFFGFAVGWLLEGFGPKGARYEMVYVAIASIIIFTASGWPIWITPLVFPSLVLGMMGWHFADMRALDNTWMRMPLKREFSLMLITFLPAAGFLPVVWLSHGWSFFAPAQLIFVLFLAFRYYGMWEKSLFKPILAPHFHLIKVVALGSAALFIPVMVAITQIF
jgi:hypothetical protein